MLYREPPWGRPREKPAGAPLRAAQPGLVSPGDGEGT